MGSKRNDRIHLLEGLGFKFAHKTIDMEIDLTNIPSNPGENTQVTIKLLRKNVKEDIRTLNLLSNECKKTSAALRVAKETGAKIGEILNLKWTDIDTERRTNKFEAEKGSNSRILLVSTKLIATLQVLPKKNEYVFSTPKGHGSQRDYSRMLALSRKYAARKLQNLRLLQIHFHTLRHWKATMEYHKTKGILHVKEILDYKNINNTLIYINLERAIFKTSNDEFTVRAVKSVDEACKLVEVGFEYVTEVKGKKIFRKHK